MSYCTTELCTNTRICKRERDSACARPLLKSSVRFATTKRAARVSPGSVFVKLDDSYRKKTDPGGGSFGALILTVKGPTARVSFWEHPSGAFAHQHARRSASVRPHPHCRGPCSKDPPARVPRVCLCVARRPHGRDIGPHRAYSTPPAELVYGAPAPGGRQTRSHCL